MPRFSGSASRLVVFFGFSAKKCRFMSGKAPPRGTRHLLRVVFLRISRPIQLRISRPIQ
jgi:hypothetical protein